MQKFLPCVDETGKETPYFFADANTGIIYFSKRHNSRLFRFTCKTTNLAKAKRYANLEFDRRTGKKKVSATSLIQDELAVWYGIKEGEGLMPDTLKNVRNARKQIEPFWGAKFPNEIQRENLDLWYRWFKSEYPDQQMENAIKYMRNFCRYLAQKVVNNRPLLAAMPSIKDPDFKKVRRERKRRKINIFSKDEFNRVFAAAPGLQERVLCLFMYTMATRVSETLTLSFDEEIHLDLSPPIYRWADGSNKADLDGYHALHPRLVTLLKELRALRKSHGTNRLFPQERDKKKALFEQQIDWAGWRVRASLDWHWTSHTFRHTCLSNLFNDERNPQALICKLYRVSLAVALETYVKPTPGGILKMKEAIEVSV